MRRALGAAVLVASLASGIAACSDDDGEDAAEPTTTSVDATTTSLTPFPAENADISHGGTAWAVVLAGSVDFDDPKLAAAQQAADGAGYRTGPTDCDTGAPEALGLDDFAYTVSVYVATEVEAQQALTAFHERGWEGGAVAQVQTYCMD